jgi:peptide deformylase
MAKILEIITYPNPILELKAQEVKFPLNKEDKELIANMWATVEGKGVGLAAPQVGVSKQICIIHLLGDMRGRGQKDLDFVVINPKIIFESKLEALMVEGCLSFPEQFYEIWRPANINVEYYTEAGKKKTIKAKEWLARIMLHEIGHLNGELFINKGGKKLTEKELKNRTVVD